MSTSRRAFLRHVGAGVLGSAGLLVPSAAAAFGRRSRVVCCPACPPCSECPECPECEEYDERAYEVLGPYMRISFPSVSGTSTAPVVVRGGGALCTWGGYDPSVIEVMALTAVNLSNVQLAAGQMIPGAQQGLLAPCRWGFTVSGIPLNVTFRLRFRFRRRVDSTIEERVETRGYFRRGPM
jgi:hypothetical protein